VKKFFSIILFFVFLFNISGYYYLVCLLQRNLQADIKQEIRKGLKESDLSLIVVAANVEKQLCWLKPGKEFRFKGELFDIFKTKTIDQQKHFYCIKDI